MSLTCVHLHIVVEAQSSVVYRLLINFAKIAFLNNSSINFVIDYDYFVFV